MAREKLSAEEIQKIVQQQLDAVPEIREDNAAVKVPLPYRIDVGPDACNWNMSIFGNASGYEKAIKVVVNWAQSQFNLV